MPNGGRNDNHGLIGGNGGVQHQANGDVSRPGSFGGNQARNHMNGDGPASQAESNRGQASMNRPASHPVVHHQPAMHAQAPHSPAQTPSPLGRLSDFANSAVSSGTPVFDGYAFRILTASGNEAKDGAKNYMIGGKMRGGFAVIATPVRYQDSGVMTFIMN